MKTQDTFQFIVNEIKFLAIHINGILIGICLFINLTSSIHAQEKYKPNAYISMGLVAGKYSGFSGSIHYDHNQNITYQLGFNRAYYLGNGGGPLANYSNLFITVGKLKSINEDNSRRLVFLFGASFSKNSEPLYKVVSSEIPFNLLEKSSYKYEDYYSIGPVISIRYENRKFYIGPDFHLRRSNSFIGLGLGLLWGNQNQNMKRRK